MFIRFLLAFAVALHRIATKLRVAVIEAETSAGYAAAFAAQDLHLEALDASARAIQAVQELSVKASALGYLRSQRAKLNSQTIKDLKFAAL